MNSPKVGRNDPCPCGSGSKFKKCCLPKGRDFEAFQPIEIPGPSDAEPHLPLVRSVVWKGHRWRAIYSSLYRRPVGETFHDFLFHLVQWTFERAYWEQQLRLEPQARHVVLQWWSDARRFQAAHSRPEDADPSARTFRADAPGPVWALLMLGYDFFCLQHEKALTEFLLRRLRKAKSFQAARYEITAAAIMSRSGFEISYLDEVEKKERHCEFIATHIASRVQVGVEAKSRVRPGVLHQPGVFIRREDSAGLRNLLRRAKKQRPSDLPFFIFVDINLPSTPGVSAFEKPWMHDLKKVMAKEGRPTAENPDPFTALFPTNFSQYYGPPDRFVPSGEYGMIIPLYPAVALPSPELAHTVYKAIERYQVIPLEV